MKHLKSIKAKVSIEFIEKWCQYEDQMLLDLVEEAMGNESPDTCLHKLIEEWSEKKHSYHHGREVLNMIMYQLAAEDIPNLIVENAELIGEWIDYLEEKEGH